MRVEQNRIQLNSRLSQLYLFRDLSSQARELVLAEGKVRHCPEGTLLWSAGGEAKGIFIVLRGLVRVVRAPGGRQHTIHTEGPGSTLGDVPFFAGGRYPATAMAAEDTECLVLSRSAVRQIIAADSDFALGLLSQMATRVRGLVERLDARIGLTVQQRLAQYLLARHEVTNGHPFTLGTTQAQAAEELGTVREVLVRELRRLRDDGAVRAGARGHYTVGNLRVLRDLAEP